MLYPNKETSHACLPFASTRYWESMASPIQSLIQAGLEEQLLLPSHPEYHTLQAASWSKSARLSPAAILCPRSASEVLTALHALITAGRKFAIRSGGHTQYSGANDIDGDGGDH